MKRALVLSGGGNRGAFEVGAVSHLIKKEQWGFDIFSGSSVGALNAAYLAQGKNHWEQEKKIDSLRETWLSISGNRRIYRFNLFSIFGVFFGGSLYKPSGLEKLIQSLINPEALTGGKPLLIPTVALEDGELRFVDSRIESDRKEIMQFLLASASIPIFFPPVEIRQKHWVDGGLRDITPLNAVLNEDPQEVVIITTYPLTEKLEPVLPPFSQSRNPFAVIKRVLEILAAEIGSNDLKLTTRYTMYPQKRRIRLLLISPEEPLVEDSLNFSPKIINKYMALGSRAAENFRSLL